VGKQGIHILDFLFKIKLFQKPERRGDAMSHIVVPAHFAAIS
jgi:hypothetical protein